MNTFSQSKDEKQKLKTSKIQIFSGVGYHKVYDWDVSPAELKNDNTNIGFGIFLKIDERQNLFINYNYIHKGALVQNLSQDYIFKYSILSPGYQIEIIENLFKLNGGIYLGCLHEYILNNEVRGLGKSIDFGMNLGPEIELDVYKNISLFINPIIELGLIKFSNSKQYSYQLRFGLKYEFFETSNIDNSN